MFVYASDIIEYSSVVEECQSYLMRHSTSNTRTDTTSIEKFKIRLRHPS